MLDIMNALPPPNADTSVVASCIVKGASFIVSAVLQSDSVPGSFASFVATAAAHIIEFPKEALPNCWPNEDATDALAESTDPGQ